MSTCKGVPVNVPRYPAPGASRLCNTCRYWQPPSNPEEPGACHRFPPTLVVTDGGLEQEGAFPPAYPDDYCGEYSFDAAKADVLQGAFGGRQRR